MSVYNAKNEGLQARLWRERAGYSRRQLADLTGHSERTIRLYENGEYGEGRPIDETAFRVYRLCCAAVALGVAFNWHTLELSPQRVSIRIETEGENG